MTRGFDAGLDALAAAAQKQGWLFLELGFDSGTLRLNTSGQDIAWNGFNWIGVGKIGRVDPVVEDVAIQANAYTMTLSGVDAEFIAIAETEPVYGRWAKMWVALADAAGAIKVVDPFVVRMDHMIITDGKTASVQLYCETRMAAWNRPRNRKFTNEDQQVEYPGDLGFEFVAETSTRTLSWGRG